MGEELSKVMQILEASVAKHGDIPLTTRHLLNILRMAERQLEREDEEYEAISGFDDDWGDR